MFNFAHIFFTSFRGAFHIYVACDAEPARLVGQYEDAGSFGELALMYNMPRAATVQVIEFLPSFALLVAV